LSRSLQIALTALVMGNTAILMSWHGLNDGRPEAIGLIAAAIASLPLLVLLPGLARGRRRAAQWGCMLIVFYIGYAIMEVTANEAARVFASVLLISSWLLLGALLIAVRRWQP
jgi:uncharacterized membrane protein